MICAANRIPDCYMMRASVETKKSWEAGIFRYFEQSRETFNTVTKQKKNPAQKTLMKSFVLFLSYSLYLFNLVFFFLVIESTTLQNSKRKGSIQRPYAQHVSFQNTEDTNSEYWETKDHINFVCETICYISS